MNPTPARLRALAAVALLVVAAGAFVLSFMRGGGTPQATSSTPSGVWMTTVGGTGTVPATAAPATTDPDALASQYATARETAAVRTATAFMQAFARPSTSVDYDTWWASVRPLLTESAQDEYEYTDPQQVPFTTITGDAVVESADTPADVGTVVRVPTDVGDYLVTVQITEDGTGVGAVQAPEA